MLGRAFSLALVSSLLIVGCGKVTPPLVDGGGAIDAPGGPDMVTLTVTKSGTGMGDVISNPDGINCGAVCHATFTRGTVLILTAAPEAGSTFDGWGGMCAGNATTCAVTLDADKSVTAGFGAAMYTVKVNLTGTASGTVTSVPAGISCGTQCTMTVAYGAQVTLNATPTGSAIFAGWGGSACSGSGPCTITVTKDVDVDAGFVLNNYTLLVSSSGNGSGTVTSSPAGINCGSDCSQAFSAGQSVTLTASPAGDSQFTGWSGACSGTGSCTVTMDGVKTVTATFDLKQFTLTVNKNGTGTGTVTSNPAGINCGGTCSSAYDINTMVTLTPTASNGSSFASWAGACSGSGACTVTMSQARTVTATFNVQTVGITVTLAGSGTGTVTSNPAGISCGATCSASFAFGTSVTLTATPTGSATFAGWSGGCSGTGACTISVTSATAITATFNSPVVMTETLVSGLEYGFDVAPSSDGYLYYTSQGGFMKSAGTVGRVLKGGGGQQNLATGLQDPFDMVQAGGYVYWNDQSDTTNPTHVVSIAGTGLTGITRTAGQFASDGTDVYWTESSRISKVTLGGTAPVDVVTGLTSPYGILVDATNIYWVELGATTATVKRRAKAGGAITTLASNTPLIQRIATDGTHIYGVVYDNAAAGNPSNGMIVRVPVGGGAVQTVASAQRPFDVAVDGSNVYWSNWLTAPTGIMKCPKVANCTPIIFDGNTSPNNLAVDGAYVYWSDFDGIKRRAK